MSLRLQGILGPRTAPAPAHHGSEKSREGRDLLATSRARGATSARPGSSGRSPPSRRATPSRWSTGRSSSTRPRPRGRARTARCWRRSSGRRPWRWTSGSTALGADEGLTFDFDTVLENNSLLAHRLLRFALDEYGPAAQVRLKGRLMTAHFGEGMDIGDPEQLTDAAVAAGLDRDAVTAFLDGDELRDEVARRHRRGPAAGHHRGADLRLRGPVGGAGRPGDLHLPPGAGTGRQGAPPPMRLCRTPTPPPRPTLLRTAAAGGAPDDACADGVRAVRPGQAAHGRRRRPGAPTPCIARHPRPATRAARALSS